MKTEERGECKDKIGGVAGNLKAVSALETTFDQCPTLKENNCLKECDGGCRRDVGQWYCEGNVFTDRRKECKTVKEGDTCAAMDETKECLRQKCQEKGGRNGAPCPVECEASRTGDTWCCKDC
ncbi:MAG: hypothetical protein PHO92_03055 [Candidatus Peribacteraceae bacterium]|nr:hypothetical protein [Candidatus Peribacteraceae bacterium]